MAEAVAADPVQALLAWEQFLTMPESDGGHEFIDGRIRPKMPPTYNHGLVVHDTAERINASTGGPSRWASASHCPR